RLLPLSLIDPPRGWTDDASPGPWPASSLFGRTHFIGAFMVKTTLTLCAAIAALFACSAYAQSDKPGEDRAATSTPSTKQQKQDARAQRKAAGKAVAGKDQGRVDSNDTAGTQKVSAEDKAAGKSSRKAAGKQAAKEGSGRLDDVDQKK